MSKLLRLTPVSPDGSLYGHIGKYAGSMVMAVWEEMGGLPRMVDWAEKNPDDFYTKVFPKVVAKPVEHTISDGVEDLLARLDEEDRRAQVSLANATDAEFEEV